MSDGLPSSPSSFDATHAGSTASEPVFREPWQAQAFVMAIALHDRGVFTWTEWSDALAAQIAHAQAGGGADHGATYYQHWLGALEALVAGKGAGSAEELERYRRGWDRAAHRTSHGQPIELLKSDFD